MMRNEGTNKSDAVLWRFLDWRFFVFSNFEFGGSEVTVKDRKISRYEIDST
jgi:hypothetical protein